jgi:hypothetical protein
VLEAKTVAVDAVPVTTPEIAAANDNVRGVGLEGSEGSIKTGDAYTGTGMTCWQLLSCEYRA